MAIKNKAVGTVGKTNVKTPGAVPASSTTEKVPATIQTPSGAVIQPTDAMTNTHYSSSGNQHGGSSGSFAGTGTSGNLQKNGTGTIKTPNAGSGSGGSGGGSSSSSASSTPNYDTNVPSVFGDTSDPELTARYNNAMAALEQMKGQAPVYGSQYDAQIKSLYEQIMGRDAFRYDQKTDPLYQQYVQDYTTQGKMAMRDTMGQAAALTGGYGSSYGQAVGQQQYDQYLQRMADILPQTYGMALDAYNAEGNRLNQNLETTTNLERSDYDKYLDTLNQYNIDVNRAQSDADTWYDRMVAQEKLNYSRQLDQYDMQRDNYSRLVGLMSMGYKPTKAEYNAAGLSEAQGEALRGAYMPAPQTVYVGGGSSTPASTSQAESNFEALLAKALGGTSTKTSNVSKTGTGAAAGAAAAAQRVKNLFK